MGTETYLEQIWTDRIDDTDLICLQQGLGASYTKPRIEDVLVDIANCTKQLWRGENNSRRFIIVTEVINHPSGTELRIFTVGGRGYIASIKTSWDVLSTFAREYGCRWVTGQTSRKGLDRVYQHLKPTEVWTNFTVEL